MGGGGGGGLSTLFVWISLVACDSLHDCMHCVRLVLWTRKILCGSLYAIYTNFHWFIIFRSINHAARWIKVPITAGSCKDNRRLVLTYPSNIYHLQTSLTFSVSLSSSAVFSFSTPQGRGCDTPLSSQHQHVAILPLAQPSSHEFSIHSSSVYREFNGARIGPAVHSLVAMSTRACCTAAIWL